MGIFCVGVLFWFLFVFGGISGIFWASFSFVGFFVGFFMDVFRLVFLRFLLGFFVCFVGFCGFGFLWFFGVLIVWGFVVFFGLGCFFEVFFWLLFGWLVLAFCFIVNFP